MTFSLTTLTLHIAFRSYARSIVSYFPSNWISQDVLYNYSSRPRPIGSIPHPNTISHYLLLHRKWHSNLPRLLHTYRSDNYCHIHPGRLHNDPHACPYDRNTYLHRHSTWRRNIIDSRRNTSVRSSGSAICCARPHSTSRDTRIYHINSNTRNSLDPRGHIHTITCPYRRRNTSRSLNCCS